MTGTADPPRDAGSRHGVLLSAGCVESQPAGDDVSGHLGPLKRTLVEP